MSWVKLDDTFWMHPRVLEVGDANAGVFARMLSYCGCYLTDGMVPGPIVDSITVKTRRAVPDLERAGLVQQLESGTVLICDYLEYNRSKAEVEADRKVRRENGRRGGRPSANGK